MSVLYNEVLVGL